MNNWRGPILTISIALLLSGCGQSPGQQALDERLYDLRERLGVVEARLQAQTTRADNLRSEVVSLTGERQALNEQIATLENDIKKAVRDKESSDSVVAMLGERIHARAKLVGVNLAPEMSAAEAYATLRIHDTERAQRQKEAIRVTGEFEKHNAALTEKNLNLDVALKGLTAAYKALQAEARASTERGDGLQTQLDAIQPAVDALKSRSAALHEDNMALARANVALRQEVKGLRAGRPQLRAIPVSQLAALTLERDRLASKLDETVADLERVQEELKAANEAATTQQDVDNTAIRAAMNDARAEAASLATQLAEALAQRDAIRAELSTERTERKAAGDPRSAADNVESALSDTLDAVRAANKIVNERVLVAERKLHAERAKRGEVEQRVKSKELHIEALEKNISALKKTDEDNRRQAFEKAQAAAQTIGKLNQRVDTLKADIDSLHGRAVKNEAALARSKDATAQAERQIKTLTRERDALEAERSKMSNALDGVVRQLATLREERDALAAKLNNRKGG